MVYVGVRFRALRCRFFDVEPFAVLSGKRSQVLFNLELSGANSTLRFKFGRPVCPMPRLADLGNPRCSSFDV